jgi:2-keto-3-deoxy-6-phosphogluconate aldolase
VAVDGTLRGLFQAVSGTVANHGEAAGALAMQKVVGSSPIIRSYKAPLDGVFCCPTGNETAKLQALLQAVARAKPRSAVTVGPWLPSAFHLIRNTQLSDAHQNQDRERAPTLRGDPFALS